jgi:hypothetical protein
MQEFHINETYSESRSVSIDWDCGHTFQRITVGATRHSPNELWPEPCVHYNDIVYASQLPSFMRALISVFKKYDDHFILKNEQAIDARVIP